MVEYQIRGRGVKDKKVLRAMLKVPRHLWIPEQMKELAYEDEPLPIGEGQTISQPYIVAYMTEALRLRGQEKVLEIGTGSGYQTAILAEVVKEVYTVELIPELSNRARAVLENSAIGTFISGLAMALTAGQNMLLTMPFWFQRRRLWCCRLWSTS